MRKEVDELKSVMKDKGGKNLDVMIRRMDSPFTTEVLNRPLSPKFCLPQLESYNGSKDPLDHIESFTTLMLLLQMTPDEVMCRAFPTTLKGAAKVDEAEDQVILKTFQGGLLPGDFFFSITKSPPKTIAELLCKAQKYMNVEDAILVKELKAKRKRDEGTNSNQDKKKETRSGGQTTWKKKELPNRKPRFTNFTPLIMPIEQVLMQIRDDLSLQWPKPISTLVERRDKSKKTKPYKYQRKDDQDRTPKIGHTKPPVGEIKTILGGITIGGTSKSLKKAQGKEINSVHSRLPPMKTPRNDEFDIVFSKRDSRGIRQPYDDPLIIMLRVEEFNIHRVLIDNGSSANIIYLPTFQQMKLEEKKIRPFTSPLVSFTRDRVIPKGIVTLTMIIGTYLA
ncbi:uncharacterized protein LOC115956634 [Quercus lobata]|uniref:uncharacterized protein LOC115956634 n=1 Tax=Quercus lobata TaxID=97700 RepID=UPI001248BB46|nr:uncharacterized protein LOC115956634 [Quercus lobata]